MSTSSLLRKKSADSVLHVLDIPVLVVRKPIKNMHLAVYPPNGRVRVSAPLRITDDNIRLAVISRLKWIRQKQAAFAAQPRQSDREMVTGESHFVFGKRFRLEVIERYGRHEIILKNNSIMQLFIRPGTALQNRQIVLAEWYRQELKNRIPPLLDHWHPIIGRNAADWGVKKMKTRWGSCNILKRRIWLNLELAKKPVDCLEYVLVHELVHLHERHHNDRFKSLMDTFLPQWRSHRDTLQHAPLGHEQWADFQY